MNESEKEGKIDNWSEITWCINKINEKKMYKKLSDHLE